MGGRRVRLQAPLIVAPALWSEQGGDGARGSSRSGGAQALAREMTVDDSGALRIRPVIEAQTLRDTSSSSGVLRLNLKPGAQPLRLTSGRSLELRINATMPRAGATVAIHVLASDSDVLEERTTISFDGNEQKLVVAEEDGRGPGAGRATRRRRRR